MVHLSQAKGPTNTATMKANQQKTTRSPASDLTESVGIGLRHPYYEEILETNLNIGWIEAHPENYFGGGLPRHFLRKASEKFPLSLHAVGLSLGSDQQLEQEHLRQFKDLIDEFNPFNISDHASWSASGNAHLNDLLPLPYTQESLDRLAKNVDEAQNYFGRAMLIENPSSYVTYSNNEMTEAVFMNRLAEMTGCGILLDINNIYVQCVNHRFDPKEYMETINPEYVGEMHLAGHLETELDGEPLIIDTHDNYVRNEVWDLYAFAVKRFGRIPTLIEWDSEFPSLINLVSEADKARDIMINILKKQGTYEPA